MTVLSGPSGKKPAKLAAEKGKNSYSPHIGRGGILTGNAWLRSRVRPAVTGKIFHGNGNTKPENKD